MSLKKLILQHMTARFGKQGDFFWYQSTEENLNVILEECYAYLQGKCFAVTAFNSGPLSLSKDERILGWETVGEIAYSPNYENSLDMYIPAFGFDEWFVLEKKRAIEVTEIFVNYAVLDLVDGDMAERFWNMLERLQPYAYMSEGTILTFVTKDEALFSQLRK